MGEKISTANKRFGAASRTYSQLLIRSLNAATKQQRDAVAQDLSRFSESEKVGFFRMQAKERLRQLIRP
jgi:hypothetical protein